MECIITIELGTNGIRVFAYDLRGCIIGSMKGFYPTFHAEPDHSEQDPEQIFITTLYVLKNILNEYIHPKKYKVASICFCASMHSVLAVDKNGNPIGNAITWADNRAKKEAQELRDSQLGKKLYELTGTPIHPMSPLVKIAWIRNRDAERFRLTSKFLSIKSYVIHQLTGEYMIDYSIASATGLLNIHTVQWEDDALQYAGITANQLAMLVPVFTKAGKLKNAYQQSLRLSAETKILIGSSDGCLATLGDGIVKGEEKASITIEDSGAVRVMGPNILKDEQMRFFNYLLTDNCYVSGGPTNNGGNIFEWFTRQFGEFTNPFDMENSIQQLMEEAANVPTGSDGLLFLPYLLGERAPIWNANARGAYFGLNIKHERRHFIRATIEGILYEIYSIGKTLSEQQTINSLSVNGSFGTIPFCSQLIADIFSKPVQVRQQFHSVSFGAYLLSATEMGIYTSLDNVAPVAEIPNVFKPNKQHHTIYADYFCIFEKLSAKLFDEFEAIGNLQQKYAHPIKHL
ncbi:MULTISPECIES: gluconokinase [unclassified Chitinophaga]|uniref:gluconokinase n=1 Tax=unclassified Chitinophaga TaxID=2619133 RepID=UPI0009D5A29D|nr:MULTISPECIES: gluconokinase [unclassified Chitinophaga]OMP75104.1 gluconokinase [[Flexibacter] sp. ATCC 35208]WPV70335.1 gluconokinase [Chitinophaga sp. LS1]